MAKPTPTWETVKGIAAALGVSMGDLAKLADKFAASENETRMRPRPRGTRRNRLEAPGAQIQAEAAQTALQ